jgi:cyclohexanecarboxylate-CoA ligase
LQQLWDRSNTVAAQLSSLGVKPGDVVAYQLPNWIEFIELSLACALCGAVANPLMHIFRQRELSFMLGFNEAKVFVTPATYRGFDFETMAAEVVQSLPRPPMHIVVDGGGPNSYANLLLAASAGATTVLQDVWDGARALEIIAAEGVTFSMASSPFVADLCGHWFFCE